MSDRRQFFIAVATILLIVFMMIVVVEYRKGQDVATRSTVLSLSKAVESSDVTQFVAESNVAKVLDDGEYRQVMHDLRERSLDTRPGQRLGDDYLVDLWGNRFEMSIARNADAEPTVQVWSRGRDGVSRTRDDIVSAD